MNYSDKELIQALAAEYVLGTLRGRARDKFETLRATREDVQQAVWYWESQLNDMALKLEPNAPREELWQSINKKLSLDSKPIKLVDTFTQPTHERPKYSQPQKAANNIWKFAVGLSTAACLVLAIILFNFVSQIDTTKQAITAVAIFDDADSKVLWSVDVKEDSLEVKSTELLTQQTNNDYQLWIVPKSGDAPISIGLLPQVGETTIKGKLALDLDDIEVLAVSIEPLGGSPTGQPTTVLFATSLIAVSS
jgi:anti-sigma-K factor RskA